MTKHVRHRSGQLNIKRSRFRAKKADTRPTTSEKRAMLPHLRDLHLKGKIERWRASVRGAQLLKATKVEKFVRPEKLINDYKRKERAMERIHRITVTSKKFSDPPKTELVLIARVGGNQGLVPYTREILNSWRLDERMSCVFLRSSPELFEQIKIVEPFIAWGVPSLKTITDLIYKRGYAFIKPDEDENKKYRSLTERSRDDRLDYDPVKKMLRIKLSDNNIVEEHLGKYDIVCIPDLIHEIHSVGPFFDVVNEFLAPFYFAGERKNGPVKNKKKIFSKTTYSSSDQRADMINEFIKRFC